MGLETSCTFLPTECPLVSHVIISFQKHHSPSMTAVPEEKELEGSIKVLRPLNQAKTDQVNYHSLVKVYPTPQDKERSTQPDNPRLSQKKAKATKSEERPQAQSEKQDDGSKYAMSELEAMLGITVQETLPASLAQTSKETTVPPTAATKSRTKHYHPPGVASR